MKPAWVPLGTDLGNGDSDSKVLQIDENYDHYREAKLESRSELLSKYYREYDLSDDVRITATRFILDRLVMDCGDGFTKEVVGDFECITNNLVQGERRFNKQEGECLYVDSNMDVKAVKTAVQPRYSTALDFLCTQLQEDVAILSKGDDSNWISMMHLCMPNHFGAEYVVGRDFSTVHSPVAGFQKANPHVNKIIDRIVSSSPLVRFAWGISTDTRLNHHPDAPEAYDQEVWEGREFDDEAYVRVERQVVVGMPEVGAALFFTKPYFYNCSELERPEKDALISAIDSMSSESLVYKGLDVYKGRLIEFLRS